METKKKSTLGKAFSRTFGRKSGSQPQSPTTKTVDTAAPTVVPAAASTPPPNTAPYPRMAVSAAEGVFPLSTAGPTVYSMKQEVPETTFIQTMPQPNPVPVNHGTGQGHALGPGPGPGLGPGQVNVNGEGNGMQGHGHAKGVSQSSGIIPAHPQHPSTTTAVEPSSRVTTAPVQFVTTTNGQQGHPTNTNGQRASSGSNDSNSSPISPRDSSTLHMRDSTGLSNSSSRLGFSGAEDQEGTATGGLNPTDILLHRLLAYRDVIKNLQHYFGEMALVEMGISKAMQRVSTHIVVPFRDGHHFLGQGGLQDVCTGVRDSSRLSCEQHASASRFVEETVVKNLRRLKQDIKNRIKALKADTTLYASRVFKERELTQERIANLAKAIGLFEHAAGRHHPDMEKMHSDPYVINLSLKRQLAKQIQEENLFARAFRQVQEQVATFEAHIINEVKQILRSFAEYQLTHSSPAFRQSWAPTEQALNVLQKDTEWNHFMDLNGHRLFPSDLADADPETVPYPCKDSPYLAPVKAAYLNRKSSVLKNWKEGYFVLTLAGWLHVFTTKDEALGAVPDHSVYIPSAVLGPLAEPGRKQHVFSIEGRGKGGLMHRDAQTITLRANSKEELTDWWTELSKRAQASTVTQLGNGQPIDPSNLSRSGSKSTQTRTSSTMERSTSLKKPTPNLPAIPTFSDPSPPYATFPTATSADPPMAISTAANPGDAVHISPSNTGNGVATGTGPVNGLATGVAGKGVDSMISRPLTLERTNTGSTVSLDFTSEPQQLPQTTTIAVDTSNANGAHP